MVEGEAVAVVRDDQTLHPLEEDPQRETAAGQHKGSVAVRTPRTSRHHTVLRLTVDSPSCPGNKGRGRSFK